jgi:hypothetical protein
VGEETGGAFGTVAGIYACRRTTHSELKIRIGLMMMAPHHKTEIKGRGIFPDKEIIPTLEDRLKEMTPNSAGY